MPAVTPVLPNASDDNWDCFNPPYSNTTNAAELTAEERGCSSVVERMLCMYEAPGSIPGISMFLQKQQQITILGMLRGCKYGSEIQWKTNPYNIQCPLLEKVSCGMLCKKRKFLPYLP